LIARPVFGRLRAKARMHLSVRSGKDCPYNAHMLGVVLSTVSFFVASYFIKRQLDEIGIPKTMVRGMVVFVLALAVAYGVYFVVEWFGSPPGKA